MVCAILPSMNPTRTDQRRMVLVTLEATNRPEHSTWDCPECHNPLVELINSSYRVIADVFDPKNTSVSAVGRRCGGRLRVGGHCQYWYYFSLASVANA